MPEIAPEHIFINCIHTHCAPAIRHSGTPKGAQMEKDQPDVWGPNEYADFALERAAGAFVEAWRGRKPGGIRRALGSARIGHCRLALYADGSAQMYGDTSRPDFVRMLESEDDGVEMLFTVDAAGKYTGVIANVACPAQVMEATYQVSSDIAGEAREKLKKVYGDGFRMIYQIGAAGCQSPRDLVRGKDLDGFSGWDAASVEALADRVVRCVDEAMPKARPCKPALRHVVRRMHMPIRRVSADEVAAAKRELAEFEAKWPGTSAWEDYMREVHHYECTNGRFPYDSKLHPYAAMDVCRAVIKRATVQETDPFLDFESHFVRIGDVAFVTNPFELYLVFGETIKARSAAEQTFLIGKCDSLGYVPTERSEKAVGYSGGVNVGRLGHQGGYLFCDGVVRGISELFEAK